MGALHEILGPRVPPQELAQHRERYLWPTALLGLAALALLVSIFTPYWKLTLHAPQYPRGLRVYAYLDRLEGDVREVDGLNHYIGMRPLEQAAQLERSLSIMMILVLSLLVAAAIFIHNWWAALLALPALLFPLGFLVDLYYWLHTFGHSLDPKAPLSAAIKPFTPPVLGVGRVGQFRTVATPHAGLILALAASALILAGLYCHRRAYKPLVDAIRGRPKRSMPRTTSRPPGSAGLLALALAAPFGAPARANDLQAMIAAAAPGSTLELAPVVYDGPVVVDRPLAIVGQPGTVVDGHGQGDVIRVLAPDVTLRGLTIRGSGESLDREHAGITVLAPRARLVGNRLEDVLFGIYVREGPGSVLQGNTISGKPLDLGRRGDGIRLWQADGTRIVGNEVRGGRDCVIWFSRHVEIRDNRIQDGRYGLHFMYSDTSTVENNRVENNSVGAFLMYSRDLALRRNLFAYNRGPSGYGVGLKDMDGVVANENRFVGNRVAVFLDNSPREVDVRNRFERNVFAYNDIAVAFLPAVQRNDFADNAFLENLEQVAVLGAGVVVGNGFEGNFWSDYAGIDLDRDGFGDLPYRAESLFENLMDREPKLRWFLFSPAQQSVELAARAFPIVRPEPKLTDTRPRMEPLPVSAPDLATPSPRPLAGIAAALLAFVGLVLRGARAEPKAAATAIPATPRPQSPVLASLHALRKRYGSTRALDGVDLTIVQGEALALWGDNGAGKTTLLQCLLGLVTFEGEVRVAGLDAAREGRRVRALAGYVPQELAMYPHWRVREFLGFLARLRELPATRVEQALREVGLEEQADRRVGALSGGMKQRLALAAALLPDPPLLVLDEITANLDTSARGHLLEALRAQRRRGKTIVFTSHRLDEVEALADRVAVLSQGKLSWLCAPAELAAQLGLDVILHLRVRHETAAPALACLREAGFDAAMNGKAVLVRVAATRKAQALAALAREGLEVVDFDLEPSDGRPAGAPQPARGNP